MPFLFWKLSSPALKMKAGQSEMVSSSVIVAVKYQLFISKFYVQLS